MENTKKSPMSEAERLQLAQKLDDELDDFINGLEKQEYTDGWPEDRWEEEMDKHPFFMKTAPQTGDELSPLMEGLQQLKYDPTENTPEDLAKAYKDDGNFNFKHKNYRLAIIAYTEGIKIKCDDSETQATLYNNRSAAHFYLQNYRSSLKDARIALRFKPDYDKATIRTAHCLFQIEEYDEVIQVCDRFLNGQNDELVKLREKSLVAKKMKERDLRKKQASETKRERAEQRLLGRLLNSGIQIDGSLNVEYLVPPVPQLAGHRVHLDDDDRLVWPVTFLYPEYQTLEFVQEFNEDSTFQEHLDVIFVEYPEWDIDSKYTPTNLNLYVELINKKLHKIDAGTRLSKALSLPGYIIKDGTPSFIIVSKNSGFEEHFLKRYAVEKF